MSYPRLHARLRPSRAVVTSLASRNSPTFSNVKLLLGADTAIVDESTAARTLTASNGAVRSTAGPKIGTASVYFNTTGKITTPVSADFAFGAGDWSIECFRSADAARPVMEYGSAANLERGWAIDTNGGKLGMAYSTDGTSWARSMSNGTVTTLNNGTSRHLYIERAGTVIRFFVDGVLDQKVTGVAETFFTPVTNGLTIGDWWGDGYGDEFRIVKGQAIWNSDTSFAVPTAPLARV